MDELRVHLFGGFLLERGNVALPPIASRVGRSLFAYLVMNRDRPVQRDLLTGSFWPDLPEGRARRRLSQTLWQIQDVVNEGRESPISATTDTLSFDTGKPYLLDVEEFEKSYAEATDSSRARKRGPDVASLRKCVDLYRGDFLAGFFDDWIIQEQDHYRQRYIGALRRLIDATKAEGSYEEALVHARRLTHHDTLSESVHQEVMRLCFLLGRTNEALEQYERLRSIWAEELDAEPSASTAALYEKILRQRSAGIRPIPGKARKLTLGKRAAAAFVGRDDERRLLVEGMERVLAGPGGVVLIEGEPGVGKTRLVVEAADDAQWRGFEVSWGRCAPGTLRPFAPLTEVLESLSAVRIEQLTEQVAPVWLGESLRLSPRFDARADALSPSVPLRPTEESTRMREALVHTLGALGAITPHLIVIDDVQWADRDTLSVLAQLGPRLRDSRTLLLLIYRSEEARGDPEIWDVLRGLDLVAGVGRIVLSPLSVFELDDMVRRILDVSSIEPQVSARLHKRTGGNALFTLETLLAWRDQGLLGEGDPADDLRSQLSEDTLPLVPRVRSVIDARMALLGEHAADLYQVAGIFGDAADLSLLAEMADMPTPDVADGLDELLHRGLLRDDGEGNYWITHDQVRQVVYERIPAGRRAALHRRVARALETSRPWDVEAIGFHYLRGKDAEHAAPFLEKAGRRAAELNAYATAAQHLESALQAADTAGWSPSRRLALLAELESVLSVLGRRTEQAAVLDQMGLIAAEDDAMQGDVERRRTLFFAHSAEFGAAVESGVRAVAYGRGNGDAIDLARALVALGATIRWSGHPLDAVPHLEEAVEGARSDPAVRAEALTELASTLVEVQRSTDAFLYLEEARRLYAELGDLRGSAEVAGIEGRALHQIGEWSTAAARFEEAIEICRQIGYRHGEGLNLVNLSVLYHVMGRVADALAGYDRAATLFAELGNGRGEAMVLANAASARHDLLGDDARALADAERARALFAEIGDQGREAQCLEVIAGVAARRGETRRARDLLQESLHALETSGNQFLEAQHLRSLASLLVDEGNPAEAEKVLDRAEGLCSEAGFADLSVELASIRATVWLRSGREADAFRLTRDIVEELPASVERPFLLWHRHAEAARAAGEEEAARLAAMRARDSLESALSGLPPETVDQSLSNIPEHAAIVAAAEAVTPKTIEVDLPALEAPLGRSLTSDDLRTVTWTVDHPDDGRVCSAIERRRMRVRRLLEEAELNRASPSIGALAGALGVSESTIRRDLAALRDQGLDMATRGSARQAS